jgi:hypothetical protein
MVAAYTTPSPSFWRRLTGLSTYDLPAAPRRSITAASRIISEARVQRSMAPTESWQQEAIDMYSEVGELRYLANAQANAVSRAILYVGQYEGDSTEPVETDNPTVQMLFDLLGGGPTNRAELIKRLSIQLFIPGDGYLIGVPPGVFDSQDMPPPEMTSLTDLTWRVLSTTEVQVKDREVVVNKGDSPIRIDRERVLLIRIWRPNPFRWWQADSPVRSNLPVLRELVGLTKHVSASIDSRLAGAGVLLIGDSFSLLAGQSPDPDDDPESDPVLGALMSAMLTAIKDRDSASAVMPIILQGPDEAIDKVQHLTFSTPFDSQAKDLRDEAIRRLALGLDSPPEVLLGMSGSNHWNAWLIQDDYIRTQIEPQLALICDALTVNYLWPLLEDQGVADPTSYGIWFDTSHLSQRADRSSEAVQLFDRGEITAEALRRETGFDESDAPKIGEELGPDQEAMDMAVKLVMENPTLFVDPGIAEIARQLRDALNGDLLANLDVPEAPAADLTEEQDVVSDIPDIPDTIDDASEADTVV